MNSFAFLPNEWKIIEFKDAEIDIIDGDRGKNYPNKSEFSTSGYCLFLNTGNIKNDNFDFSNCDFITEQKDALLRKGKLRRFDIVLTTRGTVGSLAFYDYAQYYDHIRINSGMVILRASGQSINPTYLYHLLKSSILKSQYLLYSSGSAQPQLPIKDLKRIKLIVPRIDIQKKIAAILSAYDDLIENNKRRIALLEKMAEEIYREWFVRFRFPGYQDAEFEKGIPKGWESGKGEKFFSHVKGKSYKSEDIVEDQGDAMPFVTLKSFNRGGGYREEGLKWYTGPFREQQLVNEGDVVMAVTDMTQEREVVGRVARVPFVGDKGAVISLDVIKLVPKTVSALYLYSYLKYSGFGNFIKAFANGANVLHLKPDLVTDQVIVVPPRELRQKFEEIVDPLHKQGAFLAEEVKVLAETKNMLLPRLISGKLSVEDLDISFPPSMQEVV